MTTLQRLVFPRLDLCPHAELYVNCSGGAWFSHAGGVVRLLYGSSAQLDTYFNGFSVGKWRRHTAVNRVVLHFEALGDFEVEAVLNHSYRAARAVAAAAYRCQERSWLHLEIPSLDELDDGQLYLKFRGLEGGATIFGGSVSTDDEAARHVRLGIVITTFNRPQYLARNLNRLAAALRDAPGYADRLEIVVVDNAANVDLAVSGAAAVTVIPNANLGGAGGFARGLTHLRAAGAVSHVLFMDDDISFDPEIVFRTVEVLSYARDPKLCLAGAMLVEESQYTQFESGAAFLPDSVHPIRAVGSNVDLRDWRNLVANDVERPAGYGAWWYLAFPLQLTESNPLPVFMRGDDICFGLRHAGKHTITMNGIGVWHQAFAQKNGPAAFYYEARNFPLVSVLMSDRFSAMHLVRRFVYHTGRMLLAMKYDTAAAEIAGMRQFLEGPDSWLALDHTAVNRQIRQHRGERPAPLGRDALQVKTFKPKSKIVPKIGGVVSTLVLSGHLLPGRLSRRPPVALPLDGWSPVAVVGRENVLYRYEATGEGFFVQRDRRRFFALLGEMLKTAAGIPGRFDQLKAAYREAYPTMTGDAYWAAQFAERPPPPHSPSTSGP